MSAETSASEWVVTMSGDRHVRFRLFSGVAPRRFAALFEKRGELKNADGNLIQLGTRHQHRDPILDKSFAQLEELIAGIADKPYDRPERREA